MFSPCARYCNWLTINNIILTAILILCSHQETRLGILKMRLLKIVKLLSSHNKNVVVLTVPPIPKLSSEDNVKLLRYNKFVIKMGERDAVRVLDIYGLFLQEDGTINLDLFERFIGATKKKFNMVHWNKKAIKLVEDHLKRPLKEKKIYQRSQNANFIA